MKRLAQNNAFSHACLWHHGLHSDLGWLRLRRIRARVALTRERRRSAHDPDGISPREYELWFAHSFVTKLAEERTRPRSYPSGEVGESGADLPFHGTPSGS